MNQDLQNLETKVENDGTTPQGRLSATEWNILVAAVKSLDLTGGSADAASILQVVANAGYATQEWVTSQKYITSSAFDNLVKNLVTLDTTQAITGIKDFTNGLKIGGLSVYKSQADTIYLDANLVVRGGITAFGTNETITPSIFEALPIDGITLKRTENGVLYVASGGSGGSGGGGISIEDLESYLTTNGYATQSWVTGKGYITASALEPYALKTAIPTNTNQLTNGAGFITASAIPTSLKNPNALSWSGYSSGSYDGSVAQSITIPNNTNQLTNGAGFITGITSSMVTNALGYTPVAVSIGLTSADNNAIGYGYYEGGWPEAGPAMVFGAGNNKAGVQVGALGSAIRYGYTAGTTSFTWRTILDENNYSDYALPKDGTAVAATTLKTSTGFLYTRTYDSSRIVNIGADATAEGYSTYIDGMFIRFRYGSAYTTAMEITSNGNVAIGGTSASEKLHVHGNILASGGITCRDNFRTNDNYYGFSVKSQGGEDNWYGVKTYMQFDEGTTMGVCRIGTAYRHQGLAISFSTGNAYNYNIPSDYTYTDAMLIDKNGNILATGGITATNSSDKRLKRNIRKFNASKVLMSLGGVYEYEYIDSEVQKNHIYEGTHYGLIYQHVKGTTLDVMCHERDDGFGTLNYIHPKFISLIAGATMENISEIEQVKRENRELRKELERLKQRVA